MVWTSEENALEISLQIKTELKEIWAEVAASNSSSNLPMLEKKVHQGSSILHHHQPMMICLMRQILGWSVSEIGVCSFGKLSILVLLGLFFLELLPPAFLEDS